MISAHSSSKELGARKITSLAPLSLSVDVRIKKYWDLPHFIPQFTMKWCSYQHSVCAW